MPLDFVHSACPHDCPSTCALEVERIDAHRIGRVRGAAENSYTAGVVCAKVARYAERVHHPDRLTHPLRRVGDKGDGKAAFEPIDWDDALDVVAEAFERTSAKMGAKRYSLITMPGLWGCCSAMDSIGFATRWATRGNTARSATLSPMRGGSLALA